MNFISEGKVIKMSVEKNARLLNQSIIHLLWDALRINWYQPKFFRFVLRTLFFQNKAAKKRLTLTATGLQVPPFLIISITKKCNLNCHGCYAKAQERGNETDLDTNRINLLFSEAQELGISIIMLAGGEPLLRQDVVLLTRNYPKILFPFFTNGLLINQSLLTELKKYPHLIPVISIEGQEEQTNLRRGYGIFQHLLEMFNHLKKSGIFFGVSITVTSKNFQQVTDDDFVLQLVKKGSKLFFYVEYIPVAPDTDHLVLSSEQQANISDKMAFLRKRFPALFIAFPGDEDTYGGCLASGRGFVHISPAGHLEPCPFAPFSDINLQSLSLKDALRSEFLEFIRSNHDKLNESKGGCALWKEREWVEFQLTEKFK